MTYAHPLPATARCLTAFTADAAVRVCLADLTPDPEASESLRYLPPGGLTLAAPGVVVVRDGGDPEHTADVAFGLSVYREWSDASRAAALRAGLALRGEA